MLEVEELRLADAEVAEAVLAQVDQLWGTEAMVTMQAPSRAGDARFRRWLARFQRTNSSPRAVLAFLRAAFEMDASSILPLIQAPTLILHRRECQLVPVAHGGTWPSVSQGRGWSSCQGPS